MQHAAKTRLGVRFVCGMAAILLGASGNAEVSSSRHLISSADYTQEAPAKISGKQLMKEVAGKQWLRVAAVALERGEKAYDNIVLKVEVRRESDGVSMNIDLRGASSEDPYDLLRFTNAYIRHRLKGLSRAMAIEASVASLFWNDGK
jgi:hypothetical protein